MIIFKTNLKRCLKRYIIIITLFILPVICLIIDYPFKTNNDVRRLNDFTLSISDDDSTFASKTLVDKISLQYDVEIINRDEINTVLTNRSSDWAIVIPKGFQKNLKNKGNNLIESYGFAQKEKWEPVRLNIENMISSMKIISNTKDNESLKDNLGKWNDETLSSNFNFLERTIGTRTPGTGLLLYAIIILYGAFLMAKITAEDKEKQLIDRVAVSSVSSQRQLLENLLSFCTILIVQNIIVIIAYKLINPNGIVYPGKVLLAFIVFSIMAVILMLAISNFSRTSFIMMSASTSVIILISLLGGLFIPIGVMPEVMTKITLFTPTYWFVEAIDSIFVGSSQFIFHLIILLGFSVVFIFDVSRKKHSRLS